MLQRSIKRLLMPKDEKRVEALMRRVTNGTFGQVFITDTHLGRIPSMFAATGADVRVFEVRQGEVQTMESTPA